MDDGNTPFAAQWDNAFRYMLSQRAFSTSSIQSSLHDTLRCQHPQTPQHVPKTTRLKTIGDDTHLRMPRIAIRRRP
jgi:hypothetical protein